MQSTHTTHRGVVSLTRSLLLIALVLIGTAFQSAASGYKVYFESIEYSANDYIILSITNKPKQDEGHVLPLNSPRGYNIDKNHPAHPPATDGNPALNGGPTAHYYIWVAEISPQSKSPIHMIKNLVIDLPNTVNAGSKVWKDGNVTIHYRVENA